MSRSTTSDSHHRTAGPLLRPDSPGHGNASPRGEGRRWLTGVRERLPDAIPLFAIGAAAFAISYFTFHTAETLGLNRLPIWGLFTATGAVVVAGGLAVVLAGGEEAEAPYGDEDVVVLSRAEYDELVGHGSVTSSPESWSETPEATPSPASKAAIPLTDTDALIEEVLAASQPERVAPKSDGAVPAWSEQTSVPTVPLPPAAPAAAPLPTRPLPHPPGTPAPAPAAVERAIEEVEAELESIGAALPRRPEPAPAASTVSPPRRPEGSTSVPKRSLPPATELLPARGACTTCGSRIADARGARRCLVCEEPLCANCRIRAEYEGHPEHCARCHGLLSLSEDAKGA